MAAVNRNKEDLIVDSVHTPGQVGFRTSETSQTQ
jgi:hypothetical protein